MATTYDKASLVMIPSGVKEDKLYSIKPTDGSGDFTFSRGSDIQATRVNSSGLIEKAKENLIEYSNDFSNAIWLNIAGSCTRTGGQTGYDGSSDAWLITQDTDGFDSIINNTTAVTGVHTFSVYAKANTGNTKFTIRMGGTGARVEFDLTGGSVATIDGAIDATITSAGGGWYRCSAAFNCSSDQFRITPQWASATAESVFIQDAQLNHGLIAQDYVETTSVAVVEGLTADLPRLDYSGGASCSSLLLEPSRTNLLAQGEYFSSTWTQTDISVTQNASTSPEGVLNAAKAIPNTTNTFHRLQENEAVAGQVYTFSVFAKADGYDWICLENGGELVFFDVANGAVGTTSGGTASIEDYGNGWYRCVSTATALNNKSFIYVSNADNNFNFAGDGTKGVMIYGAQFELGSHPTSYIPTYGAAANRGDDECEKTGVSDLIGQTEGTMFVEAKVTFNTRNGRIMLLQGSGNQFMELVGLATKKVQAFVYDGATQANIQSATLYSSGDTLKIAFAYKANDFVLYINGVQQGTDTSGAIPSSLAKIILNNYTASGYNEANAYKQALLFKTRLTNAELAALTTI